MLEPWDGVVTTAGDQVQLLKELFTTNAILDADDAAYESSEMSKVEASQRWGVTAGTGAGWTVSLKNGWLQLPSKGWVINSIGEVRDGAHGYLAAILSSGAPTMAYGIGTVEIVARQIAAVLGNPATSPALPLAGRVVGIDPGHNGGNASHPNVIDQRIWNGRGWEDCNTTGTQTDSGYSESAYNFAVGTDLATLLRAAGASVVLTRTNNDGVGPCVNERAAILNAAHVDVGIDIHADGGPASGRGFAVIEPVPDGPNDSVIDSSKQFGQDVRAALLATGMPTSTYDGHDGLVLRDDLAGLNLTTVPLVLIETGNMRNLTDASLLESPAFQQGVAQALLIAIERFLLPATLDGTSRSPAGSPP